MFAPEYRIPPDPGRLMAAAGDAWPVTDHGRDSRARHTIKAALTPAWIGFDGAARRQARLRLARADHRGIDPETGEVATKAS
jgi:hypothetical protein